MRLVSAFICLVINLHAGPLKIEGQPRTFNTDAGQFTTSGKFVQRVPYKVGLVDWEVFLDPFQAAYITPGSASEDILNNLLETTFGSTNGIPNWYLGIPLGPTSDDSIVVRTYEAVHFPLGNCPGPCAGGRIQVDFVPHGTDNLLSNFHWIQIVTSNHAEIGRA
jgi:hypothetical protein